MKMQTVTLKVKVPAGWDRNIVRKAINASKDGMLVDSIKMPAKPGSGGKKGGANEREFARTLSVWWSQNRDPSVFARRQGSGGQVRDKQGTSGHSGDIFADKPSGARFTNVYSVELKVANELPPALWSFMTRDSTKQLTDFWLQATEAADVYGRLTWLVLKTSNRAPVLITDHLALVEAANGWHREFCGDDVGIAALSDVLALSPSRLMNLPGNPIKQLSEEPRRFRR